MNAIEQQKESNIFRIYEHAKHICDEMSADEIEQAEAMLSDFIAHIEAEHKREIIKHGTPEDIERIRNAAYYGCESDYID